MLTDRIVFLDVETGGLEYQHPIIQIGAVAVSEGEICDQFERKLLFEPKLCDAEALRLNRYNPAVWEKEAVPERHAVLEFKVFLRKHAAVRKVAKGKKGRPYMVARVGGHNVEGFDGPRLLRLFKRSREYLPADIHRPLETRNRAIWWFLENHRKPPEDFKLETLCRHFGINTDGAHDALRDAELAWLLADQLSRGNERG